MGAPHTLRSDPVGWLRARVVELEAENARLREGAEAREEVTAARLAAEQVRADALAARVEELERRLGKDSLLTEQWPEFPQFSGRGDFRRCGNRS